MQIHHSKHHAAYVNNLNISLEKLEDAQKKNDVTSVISLQQVGPSLEEFRYFNFL